ncbi:MAG: IS200/IS605 family transposase [Thermomicrobiales bacterium]
MSYWQLYYHLVWTTRNRLPAIDDAREDLIRRSLRATCDDTGAMVFGLGVMPDHLHMAVAIPPKIAVAALIRRLKGSSSHLVNHVEQGYDQDVFHWQAEYGALSFGKRSLSSIVGYVKNQRTHHAAGDLWPTFEQSERPYDPSADRSKRGEEVDDQGITGDKCPV